MVISHPTFVAQGPQPPPGPQPRAVPRHHRLCEKLRAWWEADKPTVGLAVNCGYYMVIIMTYHGYYISLSWLSSCCWLNGKTTVIVNILSLVYSVLLLYVFMIGTVQVVPIQPDK